MTFTKNRSNPVKVLKKVITSHLIENSKLPILPKISDPAYKTLYKIQDPGFFLLLQSLQKELPKRKEEMASSIFDLSSPKLIRSRPGEEYEDILPDFRFGSYHPETVSKVEPDSSEDPETENIENTTSKNENEMEVN